MFRYKLQFEILLRFTTFKLRRCSNQALKYLYVHIILLNHSHWTCFVWIESAFTSLGRWGPTLSITKCENKDFGELKSEIYLEVFPFRGAKYAQIFWGWSLRIIYIIVVILKFFLATGLPFDTPRVEVECVIVY